MKRTKAIRRTIFALGSVLAVLYAFPFFLVIVNSVKEKRAIRNDPLSFPEQPLWENFTEAIRRMEYWQALGNSIIITIVSIVAIIVTSSLLAYYLARTNNKFSSTTFLILVASMIVPFQALMIPFVGFFGQLGILSSRASLVFFYVGFGVALSTFLYHGFIKNIPFELDEAASIDGASAFTTFRKIIFPMLSPVTATVAIINALWIWNDYLLPSLVLYQDDRTLPLKTFVFYGSYTSDYGLAMAGLLISMVPIIIFYFVMQRQIISCFGWSSQVSPCQAKVPGTH
jgi:raffinose/stachyose/melibiose transport system permease protein